MKPTILLPLLAGIVYAQAGQEDASVQVFERQRKEACLAQCGENDVDCHAICNKAPHPKPIHMNLMTECVRHCDVLKGNGDAAGLKAYGVCYDSCIGGYMNLGNSEAAPTTKTWVDLVTPTTFLGNAASETAASETTAVDASASTSGEHDHAGASGSSDGSQSALATATPKSSTAIVSKITSKASPSTSGSSPIFTAGDEKVAKSAASHQIAAAGTLIAVFVVGLILL
ncbi:hypothetical protein E6O75_ATG11677 [Venturia nashicola]|uniref:Uncharacterized protein n=1 Tax=Venturia nashicola TaxID=86259 RepID=A0A4Z1NYI5_9PEZI|nr:hypothetical protein E6O75_ATG11677 [Venturia nashicola]